MARPIFVNEVIGSLNGSTDPQYTITHGGGTLSNAKLQLANAITTAGTPLNADTLNKLVDFDNLCGYKGMTRKTSISGSEITETIFDGAVAAATRVTTIATGLITETVTLFNEGGATARQTKTQVTFPTGEYAIAEEVS